MKKKVPIELQGTNCDKEMKPLETIENEPFDEMVMRYDKEDGCYKMFASEIGKKYDEGKPMYGLIPPNALNDLARVLTYGANKYSPDNWRKVENLKERYFDAMQRHMWAWKRGELLDNETNISHLAHAICCGMFLLEKEYLNKQNNGKF